MHVPPTPRPAPAWSLDEQAPAAWRRSRAWLAELDARPDRRVLTAGRQDVRNMQILLYDKLRDSLVRFEGGGRGVGAGGGGRAAAYPTYPTYPTLRSWYRQRYPHDAWPAAGLSGLGGISAVQLSPPGLSVQVVEAGRGAGAGVGAGARGAGGGGWAAGGWVVGAGLLAALLLLARLTEICGAFKPKLRRSQSASDWQSSNNATNGQNGGVLDGEFPNEAEAPDPSGDLPPPYSSCADGAHLRKYTVDLEEPPPPYSACYVACTIPKGGIPSVHFYNNRNQDLFLHRLREANTSANDDAQLDFRLEVGESIGDERNAIDNGNTESITVSDRGVATEENDSNRETSVDGSRDDVGTPFIRARDSNNSLRSHTQVLSRARLV